MPTSRHRRGTRGVIAALLSAILPGVGQIYVGRKRRGWGMLTVTFIAVIAAGALASAGLSTLLKALVQPDILVGIFVGNIIVFALRVAASVDAYRLGSGTSGGALRAETAGLFIVLAVVLLAAPHAYLGYVDLVAHRTITSVFEPASSTSTSAEAVASTTTAAGSSVTAPSSTVTSLPTTTTTAPLWAGQDRLNILLMGGDAGVGRTGIRTDTMMVVSIDPETGDSAILQVPRNFARMPLPADLHLNECNCFPDIANAVYEFGQQHPEFFPDAPDPGAALILASFQQLMGIPIHYYALVDLEGFVDMVDAVGGVSIYVPERVYDGSYPHEDGTTEVIDIPPGEYHMDGHLALAYARSRHGSDDYNRMGRQRCVLEAMLKEANPVTLALRFGAIANAITSYVKTNIPIEQLPNLVELLPKLDSDRIVSLRFVPPTYVAGYTEDRYSIPDVDKIRETVSLVMHVSAEEAIAALGLDPLSSICDVPEPTTTTAPSTTSQPSTTTTSTTVSTSTTAVTTTTSTPTP
ncbi:MAG TPA: LCP family protein [Acidimicrobiia bacterium]|nr:LCP family protein [Acidimicrobiia bacterium]